MESTHQIEEIPLQELGQTWGPRPSERMVEHVKRHGILVPILVTRVPDTDGVVTYRVIDGNRRITAASDAGLATIPAIVLEAVDDVTIAELTLATNVLRTNNAVTEWWALDDLQRSGLRDREIGERTGLVAAAIKSRAKYADLEPRIFRGLAGGFIAPTVVDKVVRLPHDAQSRLADTFEQGASLQGWQVDEEAKKYRAPRPTSREPDAEATEPPPVLPEEFTNPPAGDRAMEASTALPGDARHAEDAAATSLAEVARQIDALAARAVALGVDRARWIARATAAFDAVGERAAAEETGPER